MSEGTYVEQHGATVFLFTPDNCGHAVHLLPERALQSGKEMVAAAEAAAKVAAKTAECLGRRDETPPAT
jgi:hypothetical protein